MRRRLLVDASIVSVGRYLSEGMLIIRGLLLASLLGPAWFGVWTSMRLVLQFSRYAHLGAREGMVQCAAYADGRGETAEAETLRRTAVGFDLIIAVLVAAVIAMVALVAGVPESRRSLWVGFAVVVVAAHGYDFMQTLLRSERRFAPIAASNAAWAALTLIVGLWAAYRWGLGGFIGALGFSYLVVLGGLLIVRPPPRPTLALAPLGRLIGPGFPIMSARGLAVVLWNTDKLMIWLLAGSAALGVYAVQAVVTNILLFLPAIISQVLHPHLVERLGARANLEDARRTLEQATLMLILLACPIVALLNLGLHLPIRWWLPEYEAAIAPGRILVLSTYAAVIGSVPFTVMVSLGRAPTVIVVRSVAVGIAAIGVTVALRVDGGFVAVAIGFSIALIVNAILGITVSIRATGLDRRRALRMLGWIAATLLVLLVSIGSAIVLVPEDLTDWQSDVVQTSWRCLIAGGAASIWSAFATHRLGLLRGVTRKPAT